jgi:hypothetical protein
MEQFQLAKWTTITPTTHAEVEQLKIILDSIKDQVRVVTITPVVFAADHA